MSWKKKEIWICKDGIRHDFNLDEDSESLQEYSLFPSIPGLGGKAVRNLVFSKPDVKGNKEYRFMKDLVYQTILHEHLKPHRISGGYVGLAAAYAPEIYSCLRRHVKREFVNVQNDWNSFCAQEDYQKLVRRAFKNTGVQSRNLYGNILEILPILGPRFSVVDLDFMCTLRSNIICDVVAGLKRATTKRFVVAVWHIGSRNVPKGSLYYNRRVLRHSMGLAFRVLRYSRIEYFEGSMIAVDVFTCSRRKS